MLNFFFVVYIGVKLKMFKFYVFLIDNFKLYVLG